MSAASHPAGTGTAPGESAGPATPLVPRLADRGTVRHDTVRARVWSVRGIAKVVGAVSVGSAELEGTTVVGGAFVAESAASTGSLEVRGPMTVAGRLSTRGSFEAAAPVTAGEAELHGRLRLAADLSVAGLLRARGALRAPNLRCGQLELRGGASVPGSVVSEVVNGRFASDSLLGSVTARAVHLHGPSPNLVERVLGTEAVASVDRVEAESVELSAIRVRFVRAKEIRLGPGAHVAAVEGRVVQIAFQGSPRANVDFRRIMLKRLYHTGSTLRSRAVEDKAAIARAVEENVWPLLADGLEPPQAHKTMQDAIDSRGRTRCTVRRKPQGTSGNAMEVRTPVPRKNLA